MVTLFFGYKVVVLTRMLWSVCALALGAVIGKYRPTKSLKNQIICFVTLVGCMSWFLMLLLYILTVAEGMELL